MSSDSANLQQRISIRAAAKLMNVSERTVYLAKELKRTARDPAVMSAPTAILEKYPAAEHFGRLGIGHVLIERAHGGTTR